MLGLNIRFRLNNISGTDLLGRVVLKGATCIWEENSSSAPTEIFVPNTKQLSKDKIQLSPVSSFEIKGMNENSQSGILLIKPIGKNRKLTISF